VIAGAGDRVGEGCADGDLQEEHRSERSAGRGRRCAPPLLPCIRQGGPEGRSEPQEVEQVETGAHRRNQDPGAFAGVEGGEGVGWGADPWL
jgi:hypothetical protein